MHVHVYARALPAAQPHAVPVWRKYDAPGAGAVKQCRRTTSLPTHTV